MIDRARAFRLARLGQAFTLVTLAALAGVYVRALAYTPMPTPMG